jgi:hypothetical protein
MAEPPSAKNPLHQNTRPQTRNCLPATAHAKLSIPLARGETRFHRAAFSNCAATVSIAAAPPATTV